MENGGIFNYMIRNWLKLVCGFFIFRWFFRDVFINSVYFLLRLFERCYLYFRFILDEFR